VAPLPARREIWGARLDPTLGPEQQGARPVLIVSTTRFNHGPAELIIACPLTRTDRRLPSYIAIDPPEGGLRFRSFVICEQIRCLARERLADRPWGTVTPETMQRVETVLRALLEL